MSSHFVVDRVHRLPDLVSDATVSSAAVALEAPFRIRAATYSARQAAATRCVQPGRTYPNSTGQRQSQSLCRGARCSTRPSNA
jgi:hypothetical protein